MSQQKTQRKRICFLNMPIEFYSPLSGGAISTIIAEMSRVLEERGHHVDVLTRVDGSANHPYGQVVPLRDCGSEDLHFIQRRISGLRWRFSKWDWPYFDYYRAAVARAAKGLSAPPEVIIAFNDLLSPVFLKNLFPKAEIYVWLQNEQRTRRRDMSAAMAATSRWLTCSGYIRDWTLSQHHFNPTKVSVVPSGVNLEQFHPRAGYDEPVRDVRVLFVGRIDPNKGPDIAVDAVAALRAEGRAVSMTVAGGKWFYQRGDEETDPYVRALHEKMKIAGADDLGHVTRDRIAEVYRQHDVVCVLSRSNEPFGLVTLEAMAAGCAVIASNRGGLPESTGGAAVLVNPDDQTAVHSALRELVADPVKLTAAKRRSLERVAGACWESCADRLESIISQTL